MPVDITDGATSLLPAIRVCLFVKCLPINRIVRIKELAEASVSRYMPERRGDEDI